MRYHLTGTAAFAALCLLAASQARGYINAGFRSDRDYRRFENYQLLVEARLHPHTLALERDPKDADALCQRAETWITLPPYDGPWPDNKPDGRWDRRANALKDYGRAIAVDPACAKAYLRRAALLWELARYEPATEDLRQAVRAAPEAGVTHAFLALAYAHCPEEARRDKDKAALHAQRAVELSKGEDPACLQVLALVRAQAGDFAEAAKLQKKAVAALTGGDTLAFATRRLEAYTKGRPNPLVPSFAELEQASRGRAATKE